MHRVVWLVLAPMLLTGTPVDAEEWVLRDSKGRRTGTVEEGVGGDLVRRDEMGRGVGTLEDGVGDRKVIRDDKGRRTGTVGDGIGNELVVRDKTGKREQILEPQRDGSWVVRDPWAAASAPSRNAEGGQHGTAGNQGEAANDVRPSAGHHGSVAAGRRNRGHRAGAVAGRPLERPNRRRACLLRCPAQHPGGRAGRRGQP